jgi:hypothetical protein
VNLAEGGLLRGIHGVADAHRPARNAGHLRLQRNHAFARQRPGGRAGVLHGIFEVFQIVRSGMQFQEGAQLAFGLLVGAGRGWSGGQQLHTERRGWGAQRIAIHRGVLGDDEAAAFERANLLLGKRERFGEIGGR